MELTSAYIPMDRSQAIALDVNLPDRTQGAALFADISGFTPLTEALLKEYGSRRGPEELTHQLNLIYDALVTQVHHYGGSVIGPKRRCHYLLAGRRRRFTGYRLRSGDAAGDGAVYGAQNSFRPNHFPGYESGRSRRFGTAFSGRCSRDSIY
ncbi:MAG: hypothetical protein U0401_09005 [Anaerolineae bacterium]